WINLKLHAELPRDGRLVLVGNHFDAPDALDPLGLDWEQVQADPRQATSVAYQYNTRKSARQDQLGLRWEQPLGGGHAFEAMAYGGRREIEQFLSVPVGAQANPLSSGGVIDLDNDYGDRKSTRLNSSHVKISYAVFCLKKKKKEHKN